MLNNVIGAVVEKVSGKPWQSSLTSVLQIKPGDDVASPHAMSDGVPKALDYMSLDNIAPAGSPVPSATI